MAASRFARSSISLLAGVIVTMLAAGPLAAGPEGTGLPLPRFVSLRAETAKLRTGPGVQYPEDWIYQRPGLPLEVIAEYHTWRKVRDWQGTQGWMHQSLLSNQRTLIVVGATRTLRSNPDIKAPPVARAESAVIGRILSCPADSSWCRVEIDGFRGWMRKIEFWGVQPGEVIE
jgi:SH3-like domain-containing protein